MRAWATVVDVGFAVVAVRMLACYAAAKVARVEVELAATYAVVDSRALEFVRHWAACLPEPWLLHSYLEVGSCSEGVDASGQVSWACVVGP